MGLFFKILKNLRQNGANLVLWLVNFLKFSEICAKMAQISAKNFDFWYMDGSLFLQNGYMDGWHFKNPSGTPLPSPKLSTPPPPGIHSYLILLRNRPSGQLMTYDNISIIIVLFLISVRYIGLHPNKICSPAACICQFMMIWMPTSFILFTPFKRPRVKYLYFLSKLSQNLLGTVLIIITVFTNLLCISVSNSNSQGFVDIF